MQLMEKNCILYQINLRGLLEYYDYLYDSSHPSVAKCRLFLNPIPLPVLMLEQQLSLNADITSQEIEAALQIL